MRPMTELRNPGLIQLVTHISRIAQGRIDNAQLGVVMQP
jgi:hypothetical protein